MINNFAVFILTHGRANNVITYKALRKQGYTGPIYLIVDDMDKQLEEYKKIYGDQVMTFDKMAEYEKADTADNFEILGTVLFARNACFGIAKKLGIRYFMELDDDYTHFEYKKHLNKTNTMYEVCGMIRQLDKIFEAMLEFLVNTPTKSLAMAQGGDMIGGARTQKIFMKRKAMNSFLCDTENPFEFKGTMNDDVNTYVVHGMRGNLFFTLNTIALIQLLTQQNAGGLTDMYIQSGTYVKSFYTILHSPSSVKIALVGYKELRMHHEINWNSTVPKIISQEYK